MAPASHRRCRARYAMPCFALAIPCFALSPPVEAVRSQRIYAIANACLRISAATQSRSSLSCALASQTDANAMRSVCCRPKPSLCCALHILAEAVRCKSFANGASLFLGRDTRCFADAFHAEPPLRPAMPPHVLSAALPAHVHALPLRGDALPLRTHAHLAIAFRSCSVPMLCATHLRPMRCSVPLVPAHALLSFACAMTHLSRSYTLRIVA